jgi:hypothetical protein
MSIWSGHSCALLLILLLLLFLSFDLGAQTFTASSSVFVDRRIVMVVAPVEPVVLERGDAI